MRTIAIISVAVFLAVAGMSLNTLSSTEINLQAHGGYHNSKGNGYYHG